MNAPVECTCDKVRYITKQAAKTAVRRLQRRDRRVGRLHAYRCDAGFWHIGHLPKDVSTGLITRDEIFAPLPRKAQR